MSTYIHLMSAWCTPNVHPIFPLKKSNIFFSNKCNRYVVRGQISDFFWYVLEKTLPWKNHFDIVWPLKDKVKMKFFKLSNFCQFTISLHILYYIISWIQLFFWEINSRSATCSSFRSLLPAWYLYKIVTQNKLHTDEGK